jgi:hypothetical protein
MPTEYPTKRLRDGEPVDPDFFNENLQVLTGKLAGRLGEQDIDAGTLKVGVAVANEAYYDAHHIVFGSDPAWDRGGVYALRNGDASEDRAAPVLDTVAWGSLTEVGGTATTRLSITTGDDTLVIFAQAQHIAWKGFDTTATTEAPPANVPVRLQYALEVDGIILDDTVTGAFFFPDPPPQQWYRATPQGDDFDYRHILRIQDTVGINNAVHANRLIRAVPVLAGAHTVELKARRIPANDYKIDDKTVGVETQIFNRRLFVLRIKGKSAYAGGVPNVSVDAVDDGQVLTLGNVFTNSLEALRQAANDVEVRNVDRGALRNEHLPSVVYGANVTTITPTSNVGPWTGLYPGYDTTTVLWQRVTDAGPGLGNGLVVTGPTAGQWDLAANPGVFIVLANVAVPRVRWVGGYAAPTDLRAIGCFALAFTNASGTRTVLGETEAYVNGHNPDPYGTVLAPSEDDVTLMWVVDSLSLSALNKQIASVEVVVCQWDGLTGGALNVQVYTQRGSICAFALKGVHT